jgi:hypothetical protein
LKSENFPKKSTFFTPVEPLSALSPSERGSALAFVYPLRHPHEY